MIKAKYGENIVVAFKYKNQYFWYISDLELWYINYEEAGYDLDEIYKDRLRSPILLPENILYFLEDMQKYSCDLSELRKVFANEYKMDKLNAIYDFAPSLLVDMDNLLLYSYYPEYISFEEYISAPWIGKYQHFLDLIPREYRFWTDIGDNVFDKNKKKWINKEDRRSKQMNDDKMTVIQEMFKKGETDELVPAVPVILDGKIKGVVDILMEKKGYEGYPEAISDIIFKGISTIIDYE